MPCSLSIRYGTLEIEYSGEEGFAEAHLVPLIDKIGESIEKVDISVAPESKQGETTQTGSSAPNHVLTTSTVATKLGAKSGSDLLSAAAFVLHSKGKESFNRNELTQEMKAARSYYKDTYQKNLSNSISTLVKQGNLLDQGGDTYALAVSYKAELEKKFA